MDWPVRLRLLSAPRRIIATVVAAFIVVAVSSSTPARAEDPPVNLALNLAILQQLVEPTLDPLAFPAGKFKVVKPQEFDPGKTHLVQSAWLHGLGCPTNATIALPNADFTGVGGFSTFTDPACPTGDAGDQRNEGLLLVKTGPTTTNFAAAAAELINVKGITISELGYDIRKQLSAASPSGSHCGAGAPRFIVITDVGGHVIGCNSPPGIVEGASTGWIRLRWTAAMTGITPLEIVRRIVILFDEGQDPSGGPDTFGAAVLDNINVNGVRVGRGAVDAN
jgi:hypothetical protein